MTIHTLLAMYEKGTITAHHLAILCLERLDPEDASSVLAVLPTQHSSRVLDYAIMCKSPGPLISIGGPPPTADRVQAARKWIEAASKMGLAASSKA
jgi:hypothetical protein